MKIGNIHLSRGTLIFGVAMLAILAALSLEFTRLPTILSQPSTQQTVNNDCTQMALMDYNKAKLTLAQQEAAGLPSQSTIGIIMARRRLQEQFCLQFARCGFADPANQQFTLQYSLAFDACLRDEGREEYKEKQGL